MDRIKDGITALVEQRNWHREQATKIDRALTTLGYKDPVTLMHSYPIKSFSNPGQYYLIKVYSDGKGTCDCLAFLHHPGPCKHLRHERLDRHEV